MTDTTIRNRRSSLLAFALFFLLSLALGAWFGLAQPVSAAPAQQPAAQATEPATRAEKCNECHAKLYETWLPTRHAQAFSSPIFQRDWTDMGSAITCLQCHTTGFDSSTGAYIQEGVTCEACHGVFQEGHPETSMPLEPNADLCAQCHKTTTDEWRASPHSAAEIQCQSCHNPHAQTPRAATVAELCGNCHKERGDSFSHSTHASSGLECSNCHMYTAPRTEDPIEGLVPTGHTFSVGSEACIGCHQDTVHTRDEILKLTGQITPTNVVDPQDLQKQIADQDQLISSLKAQSAIRLYTGLAQGAIVGLVTGGVAAWVVSRRIKLVEVEE